MAESDHINADEFRALRRLHADGGAEVERGVVETLVAKRLVCAGRGGWSLTASGRAEHLCALIRALNRSGSGNRAPAGDREPVGWPRRLGRLI